MVYLSPQYIKNWKAKIFLHFISRFVGGVVHVEYEFCIFKCLWCIYFYLNLFFKKCSLIILTTCRLTDFGNKRQPEYFVCWPPLKCCTCGKPFQTVPSPTYRGWVKVKNNKTKRKTIHISLFLRCCNLQFLIDIISFSEYKSVILG